MQHLSPPEETCFLICPIGDDGSPTRMRSDVLLKQVIAPAVEECGLQVVRADLIPTPGRITDHVNKHICQDAMVIADLTDHNANVYYELAVRHAAQRPAVHLIERGQKPPFDLKDFRTVEYTLYDKGIDKARGELKAQVAAALRGDGGIVDVGLQPDVRCLGEKQEAGPDLDNYFEGAAWNLDVMGVSIAGFFSGSVSASSLHQKIRDHRCRVQLALLHPDSWGFKLRARDQDASERHHIEGFEKVRDQLRELHGLLGSQPNATLEKYNGSIDVYVLDSVPYYSYFRADNRLVVGFYNHTRQCNRAPCFEIPSTNGSLFKQFTDDFSGLLARHRGEAHRLLHFEAGVQSRLEPPDAPNVPVPEPGFLSRIAT